jgi:hypothetical protein
VKHIDATEVKNPPFTNGTAERQLGQVTEADIEGAP